MNESLLNYLNSIKPGETVLIEYRTSYTPEFALLALVKWAKETGKEVIIDDNFDTLPVIMNHLRLLGVQEDVFKDVKVAKIGGRIKEGNIVATIPFHPDPAVYWKRYTEVMDQVLTGKNVVNIVLGLENALELIRNIREFYFTLLRIQNFLGRKYRRAFYLMNLDILERLPFCSKEELERIASTVVKIHPYPLGAKIQVVKATEVSFVGTEIDVEVGELR